MKAYQHGWPRTVSQGEGSSPWPWSTWGRLHGWATSSLGETLKLSAFPPKPYPWQLSPHPEGITNVALDVGLDDEV